MINNNNYYYTVLNWFHFIQLLKEMKFKNHSLKSFPILRYQTHLGTNHCNKEDLLINKLLTHNA